MFSSREALGQVFRCCGKHVCALATLRSLTAFAALVRDSWGSPDTPLGSFNLRVPDRGEIESRIIIIVIAVLKSPCIKQMPLRIRSSFSDSQVASKLPGFRGSMLPGFHPSFANCQCWDRFWANQAWPKLSATIDHSDRINIA